jgi:hypothetical protein
LADGDNHPGKRVSRDLKPLSPEQSCRLRWTEKNALERSQRYSDDNKELFIDMEMKVVEGEVESLEEVPKV